MPPKKKTSTSKQTTTSKATMAKIAKEKAKVNTAEVAAFNAALKALGPPVVRSTRSKPNNVTLSYDL